MISDRIFAQQEEIIRNLESENIQLRKEIAKGRSELARLKTPHACKDCASLVPEEIDCPNCCGGDADIGLIEDPENEWLCGHFKAKGTS